MMEDYDDIFLGGIEIKEAKEHKSLVSVQKWF